MSERHDQLVKATYKLLVAIGCRDEYGNPTVWRIGQGAGKARVNPRTRKVSYPLGQDAGVWDIVAVVPVGTLASDSPLRQLTCNQFEVIWIEVKTGKGELSHRQLVFQTAMVSAGHICFVARDTLDGLAELLGIKLGGQR